MNGFLPLAVSLCFLLVSGLVVCRAVRTAMKQHRRSGARRWPQTIDAMNGILFDFRNSTPILTLRSKIDRRAGKSLIFAAYVLLFAAFAIAATLEAVKLEDKSDPRLHLENVNVLRPVGDWDYFMQINGKRQYVIFCRDLGFEPPFDAGQTIQEMNVHNQGDCWSFRDMHPAYIMQRDVKTGQLTTDGPKEN